MMVNLYGWFRPPVGASGYIVLSDVNVIYLMLDPCEFRRGLNDPAALAWDHNVSVPEYLMYKFW